MCRNRRKKKELWQNQRLTATNLSSIVLASFSSAKNLITSSDPGKLIAAGKLASRMRRNSRPDEAPSFEVNLKDVYLGGLMDVSAEKLVATVENQVLWEILNLNPGAFTRMK